ncbi:hypothetical protein HaLaN_11091 [Haematococcus lacustris]|uniref:Uncharacterized protein n=1 Tax=Haematococcus lacustris TaxID=44745 RepID=A0A699Z6S7_HAELA|nr:hypothetical protein HaLaN_11091 [Haematococcus lacustris]
MGSCLVRCDLTADEEEERCTVIKLQDDGDAYSKDELLADYPTLAMLV